MIEPGPITVMLLMFASLLVLLAVGQPVVFAMGSIGVILLFLLWGSKAAPSLLMANAFSVMTWYTIIACPLYVIMAMILQVSGVVDDLFNCIRLWLGRIPGGVALAVIIVCTIAAAMSSATALAILILGSTALPYMLKIGYDKHIAIGSVLAAGSLANLIPPSSSFVIYGGLAEVSVGQMMAGGLLPGLLLAATYLIYVGIRCWRNPKLGPPLPPEERVSWRKKFVSLKAILLPIVVIMSVLGTVFFGIASPTEGAAMGTVGAFVCVFVNKRRLKWAELEWACIRTIKITSMLIWILIGAFCFKSVFVLAEGPYYVAQWVSGLHISGVAIVGLIQISFLILGCFIGETPIMLITLPVYLPIIDAIGLSRIWFGVLFLVNMQLAELTPPFGLGLFYMRSVAPRDISMVDIIRSILPFLPLQLLVLALVLFFPQLALWFPSLVIH
jgi:tripartite ATP-independent transporter DctM subunit